MIERNTPSLEEFFIHTPFRSEVKEDTSWVIKMNAPKLKRLGNRWMMQELRLRETSAAKLLKEW